MKSSTKKPITWDLELDAIVDRRPPECLLLGRTIVFPEKELLHISEQPPEIKKTLGYQNDGKVISLTNLETALQQDKLHDAVATFDSDRLRKASMVISSILVLFVKHVNQDSDKNEDSVYTERASNLAQYLNNQYGSRGKHNTNRFLKALRAGDLL